MDIFKLVGEIAIDTSNAINAMNDTKAEGKVTATSLKSSFRKIGTAVTAYLSTKAIIGFKDKIVELAKDTASAADTIDKMSQKIGVSRQAYQEMAYVFSQCGANVDGMQTGMKQLIKAMSSGNAAFTTLGVSVTDADGNLRSAEDVMWETFNALQGMENQTEKARLASELFGKSGTDLLPMLNGTAGSIEEMRKQANELGLIMGDDAVDSGVNFTDAMDRVERSVEALKNTIGAQILPKFTEFLEKITEFLSREDVQKKIGLFAEKLGAIAGIAFDGLISALEWLMDEKNMEAVTIAIEALGVAFAAAGIASFVANMNPFSVALAGIATAVALIVTNWEKIKTAIDNAITSVKEFLGLTGQTNDPIGGATLKDNEIFDPALGYSSDGGLTWGWHANGLDFVSRDQQPAILHYGEAVLNRTDAKAWRDGSGTGGMMALADKMDAMIQLMQNGMNGRQQIVLDTGVLVGETVNMIDSRLGTIAGRKERGN